MTSLSQSILWQRMEEYYNQRGPEVWQKEVVPFDITSNKYLANIYARLIVANINDYYQAHGKKSTEPFYIIEMGVGHGRFSFYLIKMLLECLKIFEYPEKTIRYVMTDISIKNIESWQCNPALKPFIEKGLLDFALFNAVEGGSIELIESGTCIREGQLEKPVYAVANYLFDTLPHDAFDVKNHQLYEVSLKIKNSDIDTSEIQYFEQMKWSFERTPTLENYYDKFPVVNQILGSYAEQFEEASFLIPIGAIQCIENLRRLSKGSLFVLVADKGIANPDFLEGIDDPDISLHGSISMSVNFDALARYSTLSGGMPLLMDNINADFQVACFAFDTSYPIANTRFLFYRSIASFSIHDMFHLCYVDDEGASEAFTTLDELLAILNLSDWDPSIFYDFHLEVLKHLEETELSSEQERGLMNGVQKVWEYFFMLEEDKDIPFAIGCLLYELNHMELALFFYNQSLELFEPSEDVYYNIALALFEQEQYEEAVHTLSKVLAMNPKNKDAKELMAEATKKK